MDDDDDDDMSLFYLMVEYGKNGYGNSVYMSDSWCNDYVVFGNVQKYGYDFRYEYSSNFKNDYSKFRNDYLGFRNDYLGLRNDYLGLKNGY